VLNTVVLAYVLCEGTRILYAYKLWGRGSSNFRNKLSSDGFVLTCFGGSSEKLRIYGVRM
jgi:hypothetical protein